MFYAQSNSAVILRWSKRRKRKAPSRFERLWLYWCWRKLCESSKKKRGNISHRFVRNMSSRHLRTLSAIRVAFHTERKNFTLRRRREGWGGCGEEKKVGYKFRLWMCVKEASALVILNFLGVWILLWLGLLHCRAKFQWLGDYKIKQAKNKTRK